MRLSKLLLVICVPFAIFSCRGIDRTRPSYQYSAPAPVRPYTPPPTYQPAEQLPRGTYQQTCRECTISKGKLTCSCPGRNGAWSRSTIQARSCPDAIRNQDGVLSCRGQGLAVPPVDTPPYTPPAPRPIEYRESLPVGPYQQACRECTISSGKLTCSCPERNGSWSRSTIQARSCPDAIRNQDGVLSCRGQGLAVPPVYTPPYTPPAPRPIEYGESLPVGPYQQSCRECTISSGKLTCSCPERNGALSRSTIQARSCPDAIRNQDGVLSCRGQGLSAERPSGPAMGYCSQSNVYGRYPSGGGCNPYGCYPSRGGCNPYGCYAAGGGCNPYGCYGSGGSCNPYGCYPSGGSCNPYGCTTYGSCTPYACPDKIENSKNQKFNFQCQ
jgi:hypothetical protein